MNLAPGSRVRMVQTDSKGTVTGVPFKSPTDGDDRITVRWDNSGTETSWHPDFLRPADTDPKLDPDRVVVGKLARTRGKVSIRPNGIVITTPEGFSRIQ